MTPLLPYYFCIENSLFVGQDENSLALWFSENYTPLAMSATLLKFKAIEQFTKLSHSEFEASVKAIYEKTSRLNTENFEPAGVDDLSQLAEETASSQDLLDDSEQSPVIRFMNAMLTDAIKAGASDIHIEHFETQLLIRYRIDGVLSDVLSPPLALAPVLISRIKVLAKVDIAEKRTPQDGRFSQSLKGDTYDFRVSTLPANQSERVVLRILKKSGVINNIHQLNLPTEPLSLLLESMKKPHGIILITGPTGSGKTTTLYSGISELVDGQSNIITIEDPIEYQLPGINQTQVNTKAGYTFAQGLKAILRQDPDVIMIGEIRDADTLQIALQASLTGHLVLSTLHTNSAVGAITRLLNMGAEPFLLSASVTACAAQRLARKLCQHCKAPVSDEILKAFNITHECNIRKAYTEQGCDQCAHQGFKGRVPLFEIFTVDEHLQSLIAQAAPEHSLSSYINSKFASIHTHGIQCIEAGLTSINEFKRVCWQPQ